MNTKNIYPAPKPLKVKISITLDGNLVDKLRILSEEVDRPLSQYINLVLKKYLENRKAAKEKSKNQF